MNKYGKCSGKIPVLEKNNMIFDFAPLCVCVSNPHENNNNVCFAIVILWQKANNK